MKSANALISLSKITKDYKTEDITTNVLKGISLIVNKGDFIAITGRSGSGKSTLMNIIGVLDTPTSGTYILNGIDVSKMTEDELAYIRNKEIGFIFQSFNLLNRASALENVILPSIYAGLKPLERHDRAVKILKDLGLENKINNKPNQLSGGQQQRVAIGRALMNNPELILADEPTGNLDTKSGQDVMNILKNLNKQGKTIVLITHEVDIAKHAKKIVTLEDGRII
ncbi:MAG: ABC transporter ATP-binding protein [Actinobacteria bacterium]|nr:ABC transporter ATP-binding protein [Actinomycetota bacterium]